MYIISVMVLALIIGFVLGHVAASFHFTASIENLKWALKKTQEEAARWQQISKEWEASSAEKQAMVDILIQEVLEPPQA